MKKKDDFVPSKICKKNMTYDECELAILNNAVKVGEATEKKNIVDAPNVQNILEILEKFIETKKIICYGGTAINNILPKINQYYDKELELPDYDVYSPFALDHTIELADIYYKHGFKNTEAKAGVHFGTFKVYVNFIPIADITHLEKQVYNSIQKSAILVNGIYYAPPNFLRMNMYLELSRPAGDVSRWKKVFDRLSLLNHTFPIKNDISNCSKVDFQRKMGDNYLHDSDRIYRTVKDIFINEGVVFFGGYANSLYAQYMPKNQRTLISEIPDFDVLSIYPKETAIRVCDELLKNGLANVKMMFHPAIDEIIPLHYEILVGKESIAFIYQPIACHSYNMIVVEGKNVKVATIDTMIAFYLAFYYVDKPYYYQDRILCMTKFLFDVQEKNRLDQIGLLKRFSMTCYGKQMTKGDLRGEKNEKYRELKNKVGTREYDMWFLNYVPDLGDKILYRLQSTLNSKYKSKSKFKSKSKTTLAYVSPIKSKSKTKTMSTTRYVTLKKTRFQPKEEEKEEEKEENHNTYYDENRNNYYNKKYEKDDYSNYNAKYIHADAPHYPYVRRGHKKRKYTAKVKKYYKKKSRKMKTRKYHKKRIVYTRKRNHPSKRKKKTSKRATNVISLLLKAFQ